MSKEDMGRSRAIRKARGDRSYAAFQRDTGINVTQQWRYEHGHPVHRYQHVISLNQQGVPFPVLTGHAESFELPSIAR